MLMRLWNRLKGCLGSGLLIDWLQLCVSSTNGGGIRVFASTSEEFSRHSPLWFCYVIACVCFCCYELYLIFAPLLFACVMVIPLWA
jgi:hypothetical protein